MFETIKNLDDLHRTFGGQPWHGIITPAGYPHIFLIHSQRNELYTDDLNYQNSNGKLVRFSFEKHGDPNKYGNKAVINHANKAAPDFKVYRSLFLFKLTGGELTFLGEYKFLKTESFRSINGKDNCFILEKIDVPIDEQQVYYVEKSSVDNIVKSSVGTLLGYYQKDEKENTNPESLKIKQEITEGSYIDEKNEIIDQSTTDPKANKANQHEYIIEFRNKELRKKQFYDIENFPASVPQNIDEAFFYCVNTGCAKTSFLVIKSSFETEIWGFDFGSESSKFDSNIIDTMNHITKNFGLNEFKLSRLFISHPHRDHISNIDVQYLKDSAEIWLNTWIKKGTKLYCSLLKSFNENNYKIIETVKRNSIPGIKVLHPQESIGFGYSNTEKSRPKEITSNLNNTSPLVEVELLNKTLLFTGDIEKEGWKLFISNQTKLQENIYVHSHHGSPTGFYLDNNNSENIYNYISISDFQIMFTNTNVYSGIPCNDIEIKNNQPARIYRTDDSNIKAYEINIGAGKIKPI